MALKPETIREIEKLATEMGQAFSPPEFIPGCEVLSISDKDQYATNNGWIEAICGQHNNQRCRWKGKFSGVQVGDYVDVLYFKSVQLFEVFAKGGTGDVSGLPVTTKGDLLGFSTLADRYPVSGNDGYILTEDSGETFGFSWQAAGSGSWPYDKIITVSQTNAGADYSTIAAALAAASAGDIILLDAGTYTETETLTATTSCTIAGISAEDTIITSSGTTITTGAGDLTLENLTISTSSGQALVITTSSNFYGHNLIISGTTDSIYSNSSTEIDLFNVRCSGGTYGFRMGDSTGGKVYFYGGSYDGSTADIAFGDNGEGYFYRPIAQNENIVFTTGTFDGIALTSIGNMLIAQDLVASEGQVLTKTATGQTWQDSSVSVSKNSGAVIGTRPELNFIEGSNITLTVADDAGNDEVDITIASSGGANVDTVYRPDLTTPELEVQSDGTIDLDGKEAFDGGDTFLRLNDANEFSSGVYTPAIIRADGGYWKLDAASAKENVQWYEIGDTTVGAGGAASVSFTIPNSYTHLKLVFLSKSNFAAGWDTIDWRANGDSAGNYDRCYLLGYSNNTRTSGHQINQTQAFGGRAGGASYPTNNFGSGEILFPHCNSGQHKQSISSGGVVYTTQSEFTFLTSLWKSTSSISSLVFYPGSGTLFYQYSRFIMLGSYS